MITYKTTIKFSAFKNYIVRADTPNLAEAYALERLDTYAKGESISSVLGVTVDLDSLVCIAVFPVRTYRHYSTFDALVRMDAFKSYINADVRIIETKPLKQFTRFCMGNYKKNFRVDAGSVSIERVEEINGEHNGD